MRTWQKIAIGLAAWHLLKPSASSEIGKLNKHKFVEVYSELPRKGSNGKTNISFARGKSGVYVIKENGKIVYVGQSGSDVYRTAIRHFQVWSDSMYPNRISYKNRLNRHRYTIRIVLTSASRAAKLEKGLIRKHDPRDNFEKYDLYTTEREEYAIDEAVEIYQNSETADIPF